MKKPLQSLELINLLEVDMLTDIRTIDVQDESDIKFENVYEWYMEAEKLIRVLANILSVPMFQAINQLRYAGHHVLKAQLNEDKRQPNIVEAYKHCKRAVYDALDFYVYKLSENYRVLLPILDSENAIKVEGLLKNHIKQINQCRTECGLRVDYYSGIQKTLIDGLNLVEQLNVIQRDTGIANCLMQEKRTLQDQIDKLSDSIKSLQDENTSLQNKINTSHAS